MYLSVYYNPQSPFLYSTAAAKCVTNKTHTHKSQLYLLLSFSLHGLRRKWEQRRSMKRKFRFTWIWLPLWFIKSAIISKGGAQWSSQWKLWQHYFFECDRYTRRQKEVRHIQPNRPSKEIKCYATASVWRILMLYIRIWIKYMTTSSTKTQYSV